MRANFFGMPPVLHHGTQTRALRPSTSNKTCQTSRLEEKTTISFGPAGDSIVLHCDFFIFQCNLRSLNDEWQILFCVILHNDYLEMDTFTSVKQAYTLKVVRRFPQKEHNMVKQPPKKCDYAISNAAGYKAWYQVPCMPILQGGTNHKVAL